MRALRVVRIVSFLGILLLSGLGPVQAQSSAPEICDYDCADSCSEEYGTINGQCTIPNEESCEMWLGCEQAPPPSSSLGCDWGCARICVCEDVCEDL